MKKVALFLAVFLSVTCFAGGYSPFGWQTWKSPVSSSSTLPAVGNIQGDCRYEETDKAVYCWTGSAWATINGATGPTGAMGATGPSGGITALTSDVTASGSGSVAATVAAIQGTTVSGTTGTADVVFSSSPFVTGTFSAESAQFTGDVGMQNSSPFAALAVGNDFSGLIYGSYKENEMITAGNAVTNPANNSASGTVALISPTLTQNTNSTKYADGITVDMTSAGTGNLAGAIGTASYMNYSGSGTISDGIYGSNSAAEITSATVANIYGSAAHNVINGGTVTASSCFSATDAALSNSGTTTNNYAFKATDMEAGTNNYGFYTAQVAGTNNWAIYTAGTAKVYLGGAVTIGATSSTGQHTINTATAASTSCGTLSGAANCIQITINGTTHYIPYW